MQLNFKENASLGKVETKLHSYHLPVHSPRLSGPACCSAGAPPSYPQHVVPKFSSPWGPLSFTTCLPGVTRTEGTPWSKIRLIDEHLAEPRCAMGVLQAQPRLKQQRGTWLGSSSPALPVPRGRLLSCWMGFLSFSCACSCLWMLVSRSCLCPCF